LIDSCGCLLQNDEAQLTELAASQGGSDGKDRERFACNHNSLQYISLVSSYQDSASKGIDVEQTYHCSNQVTGTFCRPTVVTQLNH